MAADALSSGGRCIDYLYRHSAADLVEPGEVPTARKIAALLRFDRLDGAIVAVQQNALAVWPFLEREPMPVCPEPGVCLDEIQFR